MNGKPCASSDRAKCWSDINFAIAERHVKKLQRRIYAACYHNDIEKVKTLTHLMVHSFYAKALAVKRVCSKPGSKTAGVDGVLWLTDSEKFNAIYSLRPRGYKAKPLKRVYIQKSGGRRRPLGIPAMKDRAMQTLYRFALEPIAEFHTDEHSYAYRPGRNVDGAISRMEKCLSDNPKRQWVLKADIESCFENISHEWLLEHVPMERKILQKFLKAGYVERDEWYPTEKGVAQGGSISGTLCNLTLDGLEDVLAADVSSKVDVIRYADDFIVITDNQALIVQEVIPVVEKFLSERGLRLSKEKVGVFSVEDGLTFLGWNIFRQNRLIVTVPSRKAVKSFLEKITKIALSKKYSSEEERRKNMKHVIRGWCRFYYTATWPSLADIEFEVSRLVSKLTGNRYLVEGVEKDFARFEFY